MHLNLFKLLITFCDAPQPWELYFQDSASPEMEAQMELHDNIMFYLVIILLGVAWIMVSIIRNYVAKKSPISNKYIKHGTLIELIWTITPALILILIVFPSFKLLHLMDEVTDPSLTVSVEGNQWYWSYQYPDFTNDDNEELEFDSYLMPESDLEEGELRLLEVDNRVLLPELTHVRFIISSGDVNLAYSDNSISDAETTYNNTIASYNNGTGTTTAETVDNKSHIFLARLATRIDRNVKMLHGKIHRSGVLTPAQSQAHHVLMQDKNTWNQVNSTRSTICLKKIKWDDVK